MKNSKEYSQKVHKLYRSLKRKYPKVKKVCYDEPTDAFVYAIISENISEKAAQSVIKKFADYFVDWNDLRVSLVEEIIEVLGSDTPATRELASALTTALRAIFNKYNTVSLEPLKKIGKRPAREALEKINGTSRFVLDYCMLTALGGHAIPLTNRMVEFSKTNQLVYPDADTQQIEGFLARQISTETAYEFYVLLRRQSESTRAGTKKTAARKVKTKATAKTKKKTKKTKKAKVKSKN